MSLALQTWRMSVPYSFVPAGASPTAAECLAAIKNMLDTESAGVGLWQVNDYSAVNGTLEIKRRGSPSGLLGTYRALMFGGNSPHANAMFNVSQVKNATDIYCGSSENAGTTGPEASYTAGSPYPSSRWTGALRAVVLNGSITKVANPYVMLVECDRAICIVVNDNTYGAPMWFGETIETISGAAIFASFVSAACASGSAPAAGGGNFTNGASSNILPFGVAAAAQVCGAYNQGTRRGFGVPFVALNVADPYFDGTAGMLLTPMIVDSYDAASTYGTNTTVLGVLRQMKLGPRAINRLSILDALSVQQALHVAPGSSLSSVGIYFDQAN